LKVYTAVHFFLLHNGIDEMHRREGKHMPRGVGHGDEIKEKAFALLATGESVAATAKTLGLKYSTVKTWEKKWSSKKLAEPTQPSTGAGAGEGENPPAETDAPEDVSLEELRRVRKLNFAKKAWDMIEATQTLIERRIQRAIHKEDVLDELISMAAENTKLTADAREKIVNKISALRLDDLRALSSILATLYDKQALAIGDPTLNVEGAVKFEEL